MRIKWIVLILLFSIFVVWFVASCQTGPIKTPDISTTPMAIATPQPVYAHSWRPEWTDQILIMLTPDVMKSLDRAAPDMARFCPGYLKLKDRRQAWAAVMHEIARWESGFDPNDQMTESNGEQSIGLFQLTYGNAHCPRSHAEGDLRDPMVNIRCAMRLMVDFVDMDSVVAAGGYVSYGSPPPKGLARYWSVMRVSDRKSKHFIAEIRAEVGNVPGCQ